MITIIKTLATTFLLFFLSNCSGFKPLYKNNIDSLYKLQEFAIVTDQRKISKKIKKNLIKLFPSSNKTQYILKIEGLSKTSGTVSDTTRKISRYKTKVSANVKLYYRYPKYDKLIYEFDEERDTSFSLILNNIRSTIASKKNAEITSIRLLSEEIYRHLLVFLSKS